MAGAADSNSPDVSWGFVRMRTFAEVLMPTYIRMAYVSVVHRVVFVECTDCNPVPKIEVRVYSIDSGKLLGAEALLPDFKIYGVTPKGTLLVANQKCRVLEISGGLTPVLCIEVPLTAQLHGRLLLSLTCCSWSGKIVTLTTDYNIDSPAVLQLFGDDKHSLLWQSVTKNYMYRMYFIYGCAELVSVGGNYLTVRRISDGAIVRAFQFPKYPWNALVPCDGNTAVLARDSFNCTVVKLSLRDGAELERYSNLNRGDRCCGCLGNSNTLVIMWNTCGVTVMTSWTLRCTWVRCVGLARNVKC